MDKIRRFLFIIGAEGASFFEWAIWTILLIVPVGIPLTIALMQSLIKGLLICTATGIILFFGTMIFIGISDAILSVWPFEVSDEELDFEENYVPRIPPD